MTEKAHPAGNGPGLLAGKRLLVVDDDADICSLIELTCAAEGAIVSKALSAKEAFAVFEEQQGQFDAVITDYSMPGEDGRSLMLRMKKRREFLRGFRRCKSIMVTAFPDKYRSDEASVEGFDDYITKPFVPADLVQRILRTFEP